MPEQLALFPNDAGVRTPHYPATDLIRIPFEWVSVDYLMSLPSIDFGTEGLVDEWNREHKRSDGGYQELLSDIADNGFMDPVYVYPVGPDNWDPHQEQLGNGHHRILAAYDLGYTHVPVTQDEDYQWESSGMETR